MPLIILFSSIIFVSLMFMIFSVRYMLVDSRRYRKAWHTRVLAYKKKLDNALSSISELIIFKSFEKESSLRDWETEEFYTLFNKLVDSSATIQDKVKEKSKRINSLFIYSLSSQLEKLLKILGESSDADAKTVAQENLDANEKYYNSVAYRQYIKNQERAQKLKSARTPDMKSQVAKIQPSNSKAVISNTNFSLDDSSDEVMANCVFNNVAFTVKSNLTNSILFKYSRFNNCTFIIKEGIPRVIIEDSYLNNCSIIGRQDYRIEFNNCRRVNLYYINSEIRFTDRYV